MRKFQEYLQEAFEQGQQPQEAFVNVLAAPYPQ